MLSCLASQKMAAQIFNCSLTLNYCKLHNGCVTVYDKTAPKFKSYAFEDIWKFRTEITEHA